MQTPFNASASSAGALLSGSNFEIPQFQREYSWESEQLKEFFEDLMKSLDKDSYFLGLIILTDNGKKKHVVDGQQRLLTLSLLAISIYYEAIRMGRKALAERIHADFLQSIDYDTDAVEPRLQLSDIDDDKTYRYILTTGKADVDGIGVEHVSLRIVDSYEILRKKLADDLREDPFKRLGKWTEFLTHKLYFAVFVHPDPSSAYQVYEVINTRGKELTTADLLKNYVLNQTAPALRQNRYREWQNISKRFSSEGSNNFVQYIRHVVTVKHGHVLPRDLFSFLAQRSDFSGRRAPSTDDLMADLNINLALYLQMIDPTLSGPGEPEALRLFAALNSLGVIAVRPILLATAQVSNSLDGMRYILRLVVRRIVVGNLGTGNVERRLSEAAKKITDTGDWTVLKADLEDLNPTKREFVEQLERRSFNKGTLSFIRRSVLYKDIAPRANGVLHLIWNRQATGWEGMSEEDGVYWGSTLGNSYLSTLDRRPREAVSWQGFKLHVLPYGIENECSPRLQEYDQWDAPAIETEGKTLAAAAGDVWFE